MRRSSLAHEECVFTIGHSTRSIDDFIAILNIFSIEQVMDVRTIPRSRHNPQFNKDTLPNSLKGAKIRYLHVPKLGGLRRPLPDSTNKGWRNLSFRGYADYMQTDEFKSALQKVIELSKEHRIVLMCAEAVPWRCHRSLIADALLVRKIETNHILSSTASKKHKLTPWARVKGKSITYPLLQGLEDPLKSELGK